MTIGIGDARIAELNTSLAAMWAERDALKARVLTEEEESILVELLDATDYAYWKPSAAKLFRAIRSKLTAQEEGK